jgi:hypothetical protein
MFKDGFSLPALAEKIMFPFEFKEFNNEFVHQQISKTSYKEMTNWTTKRTNYIEQDKKTERYNKEDFIQIDEVKQLMNEQSCKCVYCWQDLYNDDWSLDRINNDIGHNSNNCVLSCIFYNTQRKDTNYKVFYRKKALLRYAKKHPLIYLIDEANKEVFYKLKNNITGGASIVFHRYHEANETKIKRPVYENGEWNIGEEGKMVKYITGFDANALYLWCIGNNMPCGTLQYTECDNVDEALSKYGFIEVDIETPESLYNKHGEFPLIFKNIEYDINEEVGETMLNIYNQFDQKDKRMTKKLISSYKGEKVLIKSERLNWLVKQGLIITKVYGYIECEKGRPFEKFMEKVSDERRKGDVNPDHSIIAEM